MSVIFDYVLGKLRLKDKYKASEISYDNTESGITAEDVQDAIDEVIGQVEGGAGQTPDTTEFIALTNTNGEIGTWTDVSANAKDDQTDLTIFPGVSAENAFYLGSDVIFGALEFFNQQIAMVLGGGEIVVEYWNGVAWIDIDVMETNWDAPHESSANVTFELHTNYSQRVDFHQDSALKTLDGNNKHWLRWRIVTAITTSPVVRNAQVEFSRIRINPDDGFVELFGQAEKVVDLTQQSTYDAVGFIAVNHNVLAGPNTSLVVLNNARANSNADGSGNKLILPLDLDTSKSVLILVRFAIDTNQIESDVEIEVHTAGYEVGDTLTGLLAEKADKQIITIPANSQDVVFQTLHTISIEEFLAGTAVVFNSLRDARGTNADDTFPGAVYVTDVLIQTVSWRL